jgi:hypothetical protein
VPTSTDLVKDGATAIESLGDAIDSSLTDLKGGTTGQVLSKASNTDMDFTWVTDAAGDITGVTAGTGISGGGTSGTVTITNSMATEIDAKGDLIAGTGADAFARLGVGANGTILTADSAESTGLKWATPSVSINNFFIIQDNKSSGSQGGTFTSGAWRTRDLQTTQVNSITSASLASNQITLPAGTYAISASAEAWKTGSHQTRFYNITDSTVAITGSTEISVAAGSGTRSFVEGVITIAASKVFELQHQAAATVTTQGFGAGAGFTNEIFSTVTIQKVA